MKRTKKELAKLLQERVLRVGAPYEEDAEAVANFLGVEFAPEKPELPEWFGEEVELEPGAGYLETPMGDLGLGHISEQANRPVVGANRRGLVEGYNRFVRMKRELEDGDQAGPPLAARSRCCERALRIARGEELE